MARAPEYHVFSQRYGVELVATARCLLPRTFSDCLTLLENCYFCLYTCDFTDVQRPGIAALDDEINFICSSKYLES